MTVQRMTDGRTFYDGDRLYMICDGRKLVHSRNPRVIWEDIDRWPDHIQYALDHPETLTGYTESERKGGAE